MRRLGAALGVCAWVWVSSLHASDGTAGVPRGPDVRDAHRFVESGLSSLDIGPVTPMMPRAPQACAAPGGGVRARDALSTLLLEEGRDRSPTFAALASVLDGATVLVEVEVASSASGPSGRLTFQGLEGGLRRLRVRVDPGTTSYGHALSRQIELIAILGHELQHAVEVAGSPAVVDAAGFARLYRTIGTSLGDNAFDTAAARSAGEAVLHELRNGGAPSALLLQRVALQAGAGGCLGAAL